MMLQWTDTTAETQGDMEREQEMTHITEDDKKWATWWLTAKMYKTWSFWLHGNYFILYALWVFSPHVIHRIKNALKGGWVVVVVVGGVPKWTFRSE